MYEAHKGKIQQFYERNKRMPVYSEIMKLFGYKSKNAASKLVDKLIDAGYITKDNSGKLLPLSIFSEIPMLGSVKAGFPADVEQTVYETINLDDMLIDDKDKTFMLEVDGDSMIDAHIADGDKVLAERATTAKDGQIVIAEVDGEFTMKYYRNKNGKVWLDPANKNFNPIYPKNELKIQAIVTTVIRQI